MKNKADNEVFAGQLVAQGMLIQILMGQIVATAQDRGAGIRGALIQGNAAIMSNPNMTEAEKLGATRTLEDAIDTLERIASGFRGN
ncbi:MAG: hypothetical protein EA386_00100 [Rhodobacteraceae bacterium]|nr:MAG: hypothetical protein EA386_00100 [Paracoccaceae bacterium]